MKYIKKLICVTALVIVVVSCIEEYDRKLNPTKPEEVTSNEYLNSFDVLKSYVANQTTAPFQLGVYLSPSDFLAKELPYSMACTNFQALETGDFFTPVSVTNESGDLDFSTLQTLVEEIDAAALTLYGGVLLANTEQRAEYLNGLIAPIVIPVVPESGVTTVKDFENDALGTTYPMTGNSTSTVEEDPDGKSGHVLRVGNAGTPANRSYPKFEIELPAGRVLGDYTTVSIDFRGNGSYGLYGGGMVMAINNKTGSGYKTPSGYGCASDSWGRGVIVMELSTIALTDEEKNSASFTLHLGSGTGAGNYLIDNIKMAYEVSAGGKVTIDFENDNLSKEYPMTGNSLSVVENDPDGKSGKVLHVGTTGNLTNYSYPKFQVKLSQPLSYFSTVSLEFRGTGSTGLYGSGMRLIINGREKTYGSPSSFGCGNGAWGRGMIVMNLADFGLTDAEKQLTSLELAVGSGIGGGDYYIDNIALTWKASDIVIEKTEEEKKDILTAELEKWIGGMVASTGESVKAWNIVSEPLDNTASDANTFYWKDYLGEPDYARTAVRLARAAATTSLDLFVSNTFEPDENSVQKVEDLITLIAEWEADNVTKINGINVILHLNYSKNLIQQQANEQIVSGLFGKLAASGKQIRISDLKMTVSNAAGTVMKAVELTADDRSLAADYYAFVFKKYFSAIAKEKQYGISFAQMVESKDDTTACPWNVNNNRTGVYIGIVDGLKQE
jgi:hypothetical protein